MTGGTMTAKASVARTKERMIIVLLNVHIEATLLGVVATDAVFDAMDWQSSDEIRHEYQKRNQSNTNYMKCPIHVSHLSIKVLVDLDAVARGASCSPSGPEKGSATPGLLPT